MAPRVINFEGRRISAPADATDVEMLSPLVTSVPPAAGNSIADAVARCRFDEFWSPR